MEGIYNHTFEYLNFTDLEFLHSQVTAAFWAISCFAFPIICAATYGLYCLIKSEHVTPVYVINLLMSDMLQICTKPVWHMISPLSVMHLVLFAVYSLGVVTSICFMLCISAERYVAIAYPIWYRCRHTKKMSLWASFMVWVAAVLYVLIVSLAVLTGNLDQRILISGMIVFYLLPYPLVICFSMGTWRALSNAKSVPAHERRRIMGTLALVLFIYTVLFLPFIILMLTITVSPALLNEAPVQNLWILADILLALNPMVDPILYVFMRRC